MSKGGAKVCFSGYFFQPKPKTVVIPMGKKFGSDDIKAPGGYVMAC